MAKLAVSFVLGVTLLLGATVGHAGQVILDNSLGPGGPLSGPNYDIPDTVGRTVGNNLFHSFSQFNLDAGDVATFTGPASIQNVLSRVTGGASTIDGTIQCTIVGANFFLVNPFGVIFGQNAKVDVSGSFAVTTADYVKLADGGRFDARSPANDILTTAPVSAFGFLGPTVAPITIQGPGADVETPVLAEMADGKTFLIIGGDTRIDNVQITAPSGRVALISVNSAGEVGVNVDDLVSRIDTSIFEHLGNIELTTFAVLVVSGDPGGRIDIQAQNLTMREASLGASSLGLEDGLGIEFNVRDAITLRGGTTIFLDASDVGAAGNLSITAKSIGLLGEVDTDAGGVNIVADTFGVGKAGDITLHTDTLVMQNGAVVSAITGGPGDGGNINITAKSIVMAGQQSTAVLSTTSFEGKAGNITIHADSLSLKADAQVTAEAFGPSPAGTIQITAKEMVIDDAGGAADSFAGISANSETTGFTSGLRAGDINMNVDTLDLRNSARISSSSATDSPGGDILVNAAREIQIAGSQITTRAGGDGGNIHLSAPSLVYLLDSQITAASASGNGGGITISAVREIRLAGSEITTRAGGDGGNIHLGAPSLVNLLDSEITAESVNGNGGDISINATREIRLAGSKITTRAGGDGGNVHLTTPDLVYLLNSQITAQSVNGNGGNITIDPQFVILDTSALIASAIQGNGGNISIVTDFFLQSGSVIDVSSEFGLQGNVSVTAPDADLSGSLVGLTTELLDAETLLRPHCAERLPGGVSSFIVLDRGGVPVGPEMLLPAGQTANGDAR